MGSQMQCENDCQMFVQLFVEHHKGPTVSKGRLAQLGKTSDYSRYLNTDPQNCCIVSHRTICDILKYVLFII